MNRRKPCPSFTCPYTGSTSTLRSRYNRRPRLVSSFLSIRSLGLSPWGMRPRGQPRSRNSLRCFQSLVVAINNYGPSDREHAVTLASLQSRRVGIGQGHLRSLLYACRLKRALKGLQHRLQLLYIISLLGHPQRYDDLVLADYRL